MLCASLGLKSQVPGYLGRRTTVGGGFYANPAFAAALFGYGRSPLNTMPEAYIERVVKNRMALGFSFRPYKTTYENTGEVEVRGGYSSSFRQVEDHPGGAINIQCRGFAFYAKFFRSRYLAPWGRYMLLGLAMNDFVSTYDPDQMRVLVTERTFPPGGLYPVDKNMYYNNFGPVSQSFKTFDLVYGSGRSRIFWDHVVVDYGYSVNLVALTLTLYEAFDDEVNSPQEYIEYNSTMRVRGINRFNFFIKAGYLF